MHRQLSDIAIVKILSPLCPGFKNVPSNSDVKTNFEYYYAVEQSEVFSLHVSGTGGP